MLHAFNRMGRQMADMDRGAKGWLYRTASANFWRVSSWYEFEDLIQDGAWMFHRVASKYPNVSQKHLMALFKTAYTNHVHDLAKRRTRNDFEIIESNLDPDTSLQELHDRRYQQPDTSLAVAFMPATLRRLIDAMQSDPRIRQRLRIRHVGRETTNERLASLCGVDAKTNPSLWQELQSYLQGDARPPQSAV